MDYEPIDPPSINIWGNMSRHQVQYMINEARDHHHLPVIAKILFVFMYICMIILGIIGNVTVLNVIRRKKVLQTARNKYIINLTISDLMMCAICMSTTLGQLVSSEFTLGDAMCKLTHFTQCSNVLVSTCTIVVIALDRYTAIVIGLSDSNHCYVRIILASVWVVSLILSSPFLFWYRNESVKFFGFVLYDKCIIEWPSETLKHVHNVILFCFMFLLPLTVLVSVYFSIKRYLDRHMMYQQDPRRTNHMKERNRKTTMLLVVIASVFIVCWLPLTLLNTLADFNYLTNYKTLYSLLGVFHLLATSTAVTNPILYGWMNSNLRREILDWLPFISKHFRYRGGSSVDTYIKQDQDESPTRDIGESVTYSTVIMNSRLSPNINVHYSDHLTCPLTCKSKVSKSRKNSLHSVPEKEVWNSAVVTENGSNVNIIIDDEDIEMKSSMTPEMSTNATPV